MIKKIKIVLATLRAAAQSGLGQFEIVARQGNKKRPVVVLKLLDKLVHKKWEK